MIFVAAVVASITVFWSEVSFELQKLRHLGLVNYDHGIISREDLDLADKDSFPATRFDGTRSAYPYWLCFNKKYLKFECDYVEPRDQRGSSIGLDIETENEIHTYSIPHAISGEECDLVLARIKRVLVDRTYFCINGLHDSLDNKGAKRVHSWTFNRLKTKSGYARYFSYEGETEDPD